MRGSGQSLQAWRLASVSSIDGCHPFFLWRGCKAANPLRLNLRIRRPCWASGELHTDPLHASHVIPLHASHVTLLQASYKFVACIAWVDPLHALYVSVACVMWHASHRVTCTLPPCACAERRSSQGRAFQGTAAARGEAGLQERSNGTPALSTLTASNARVCVCVCQQRTQHVCASRGHCMCVSAEDTAVDTACACVCQQRTQHVRVGRGHLLCWLRTLHVCVCVGSGRLMCAGKGHCMCVCVGSGRLMCAGKGHCMCVCVGSGQCICVPAGDTACVCVGSGRLMCAGKGHRMCVCVPAVDTAFVCRQRTLHVCVCVLEVDALCAGKGHRMCVCRQGTLHACVCVCRQWTPQKA